jgi:hypothetical protein
VVQAGQASGVVFEAVEQRDPLPCGERVEGQFGDGAERGVEGIERPVHDVVANLHESNTGSRHRQEHRGCDQ